MFQIATQGYASQEDLPNKCISGGQNPILINDMIANSSKDDSFYSEYQKKFDDACDCKKSNILKVTKQIKESIEPKIKKKCIEKSMSKIHLMTNRNRLLCDSNYSVPKFRNKIDGSKDVCITEQVVDYVYWSVNEALKCINSLTYNPISPDITFMKLNRESKFGFYIQYNGGIGIGQLTSIAVKEVEKNGSEIIQAAKKSPECKSFHNLLNRKIDYTDKGYVRLCQLTNYGEGIGRNLFYSLALMLHHRDYASNSVSARLARRGFTDKNKVNYFTLVSYGRNGLVAAEEVFDRMAYKLAVKKNTGLKNNYKLAIKVGAKEIQALSNKDFIVSLRAESEYVNENFDSLEDFYTVNNYVSKKDIPNVIAEESICVSQ